MAACRNWPSGSGVELVELVELALALAVLKALSIRWASSDSSAPTGLLQHTVLSSVATSVVTRKLTSFQLD